MHGTELIDFNELLDLRLLLLLTPTGKVGNVSVVSLPLDRQSLAASLTNNEKAIANICLLHVSLAS